MEITIPKEYPIQPPIVNFKTKIFHPNIQTTGYVCIGILSKWNSMTTLDQSIVYLFKF